MDNQIVYYIVVSAILFYIKWIISKYVISDCYNSYCNHLSI